VDVGGTLTKSAVVNANGEMLIDPLQWATSPPLGPDDLLESLYSLRPRVKGFDRVSIGFPGMLRKGVVLTAPLFCGTAAGAPNPPDPALVEEWRGFHLRDEVANRLGVPALAVNDSVLHAAGAICGLGVECVITLGTGIGSTVAQDGVIGPHFELAHHPIAEGKTYNEWIGDAALKRIGRQPWLERVELTVSVLAELVAFDWLYIGGGNSRLLPPLPDKRVRIIDPLQALPGGARIWELTVLAR
jgi:polyphosphate glucokinase